MGCGLVENSINEQTNERMKEGWANWWMNWWNWQRARASASRCDYLVSLLTAALLRNLLLFFSACPSIMWVYMTAKRVGISNISIDTSACAPLGRYILQRSRAVPCLAIAHVSRRTHTALYSTFASKQESDPCLSTKNVLKLLANRRAAVP